MTRAQGLFALAPVLLCCICASAAVAQDTFALTSPAIVSGGDLPSGLKCSRDGGDGLSPPLVWSSVPEGTQSLAVIMEHHPRGKIVGTDAPSQYWLLWNIPAETTGISRGNPTSLGEEGADKDERRTGYTPPCSLPGARHEYTVTLYALNAAPDTLPVNDSPQVDWTEMTQAIEPLIISSSSITFWN